MTAGPVEVAGRYRLGETLGAGGMGRVWVARDGILQRDVAVKEILLPPDLVEGERDSVHRRTVQEARAAAQLSHPNVAQVYDVIEDDGRAWIVMEYVPSRSLQEAIRTDGPLDPRDVAVLGLEVLGALEAAHRAGVRHRDVKPANVLLGDDGRVVLTDFGIASIEGDSVITTSHEPVLGSPSYMSPERAKDGKALEASDLWSLGATLYAAVEGRPPYQRPNAMATLTALATEEPDPPVRAGALRPVLDGLLQKDPAARIDAAETRRRLLRAAEPETPPAAAGPRPHRLRRRYAVTGATLAALLAG
ncbi:serine/threonine-protein kinase, partial [Actinoplanes sp. RD1]|uniref:serine/threonine-protein kinase n=1 Tax=Actinoplanes sp. RD1 TaxID=3064538 RepID=UPI002740EC3E